MDLIKLLDVANPKKIKDTLNILIENYENFGDRVQGIADKAAEDSAAALAAGNEAKQIAQENTESLEQSIAAQDLKLDNAIAAQDGVVAQAAEDSANAKQTAEEALAMIEQADARSEEATALAEQAIATADEATATSELAMNVATEAKSTVDQAISTGVFGTFVHNSVGVSLLHAYMTDDINAEDTDERFHIATPKLVREALNGIDLSELNNALENKVDKVEGKGLSTNDYTTAEKEKLAGLEKYNDTALSNRVTTVENNKADKTELPTKTSDLTNDSGFITGYTETDPTVPSWAKQASKPTYTASEVGALSEIPVAAKDVLGGVKIWYENETLYILTEENAGGDSVVVSPVFGENSPQTISAVAELISANNMTSQQVYDTYGWSLGDTCDITLSSGETIQMQIIGFNHDDKSGGGKAGITLQMKDCLATTYTMNDSDTNAGGYAASKMKTETLPTLKALLPQEWQDVIKLVNKKSANGGKSNYSETLTLSEDLFLFAEIEIFGTTSYAQDGANEGSVYEYWNGKAAADRVKKYDTNADGVADAASNWWLRSARATNTSYFCMVYTGGSVYPSTASASRGMAFGFCI